MPAPEKPLGELRTLTARRRAEMKATDPERVRELDRDRAMRGSYGISAAQYDEMLANQSGLCAICRQPCRSTNRGRPRRLAVDHDHQTGRIRGLLCLSCNTAMAAIERAGLDSFARYLGDPPA